MGNNTQNFKKGQKVVRTGGDFTDVVNGETYTVAFYKNGGLVLEGSRKTYMDAHFKPAMPRWEDVEVGDTVTANMDGDIVTAQVREGILDQPKFLGYNAHKIVNPSLQILSIEKPAPKWEKGDLAIGTVFSDPQVKHPDVKLLRSAEWGWSSERGNEYSDNETEDLRKAYFVDSADVDLRELDEIYDAAQESASHAWGEEYDTLAGIRAVLDKLKVGYSV